MFSVQNVPIFIIIMIIVGISLQPTRNSFDVRKLFRSFDPTVFGQNMVLVLVKRLVIKTRILSNKFN